MRVYFLGYDSWRRPVYKGDGDKLYVDVDPRSGRTPDMCTKQYNAFDGEPCDNVSGDFEFVPARMVW